ncbi:MAG TPA: tRNA threonylcarbamoyladenosine dehydratase [Lachnospiraceae bacterium]|nr:tRNA threonylcarbamoyladenosine dehydratase [Lachnospiraceae bacterium]
MNEQFKRTELLIGSEGIRRLNESRVAIFGIGGVGGYVCEALIRSGISSFDIIDKDKIARSNINRQIIALHSTIGRPKVEIMKQRMLDINPLAKINTYETFFLPDNSFEFPFDEYDYVVDAVDTVTAKIELIMQCKNRNIPVISSMGAGNKLDASAFEVADIYKTSVCPLAKVMRRELRKRGVKSLKVVYSKEEPIKGAYFEEKEEIDKKGNGYAPGSVSFVPSVLGLIIAGEVVKDLTK